MSELILLGPQRFGATVADALASVEKPGRVAVITCGWQERELEMDELIAPIDRETVNLKLHARGEAFFKEDRAFREAHRQHQIRMRKLQELYNIRLRQTLGAVHRLIEVTPHFPEDIMEREGRHAMSLVRELDQQHLEHIRDLQNAFLTEWRPEHRPAVRDHHYQLAEILDDCDAVLIAGGHVAVLLNRLRLFNLHTLIQGKALVAFSAGAMVLGERVVLFHDSPPQGAGYAEVFEAGLGLFDDIIPLPDAAQRLQLNNRTRVSLFAGRFENTAALTFGTGSRLDRVDGQWRAVAQISRLNTDGSVEELTS